MQQTSQFEHRTSIPLKIFATIVVFATLGSVSADIYVPSMPSIAKSLNSNPASIQLTFFVFMLGFSLAHLIFGPLSDRIGRRKPMLVGIAISMVGTILCALAPSIYILVLGRLVQGIGVAVCNSVGRSVTRDLLAGSHLAKLSSYLGMVMIFVTTTAPILGGYIQSYLNWRAVFLFLFIYSCFVWIMIWKVLPETNQNLNPEATKGKIIARNYFSVLTNKSFIGYTLCSSLSYAGVIAYVTSAPFLLQTVIGLTPVQFGWLTFVIGGAVFISFLINSQLVVAKGINKMILIGNWLMIAAGVFMLLFALLGFMNIYVIMTPVALFCLGAGFNFGNASAGALHSLHHMAGTAGALFGCIQILGGACASALMAGLSLKDQIPLAVVFIVFGLIALISWKLLAEKASN